VNAHDLEAMVACFASGYVNESVRDAPTLTGRWAGLGAEVQLRAFREAPTLQPGKSVRVATAGTISHQPPKFTGARRQVGELSRWALAKREGVVERSHALSPTQEPPPAETRIVVFLGVTTRASSITRIFPAWAGACDLNLELRCIDLPLARISTQLVRRKGQANS
jgi:hypothetical protein